MGEWVNRERSQVHRFESSNVRGALPFVSRCVEGNRFCVPGPGTQVPVPRSQHPVPSSQVPAPSSQFPGPSTQFPGPSSQVPAPRSQHPVPRSQHPVPRSQFPVPRSQHPGPIPYLLSPDYSPLICDIAWHHHRSRTFAGSQVHKFESLGGALPVVSRSGAPAPDGACFNGSLF